MASQHLNASGEQGDGGKLAHYAHRAVCRRSASWARVVSVTAGMWGFKMRLGLLARFYFLALWLQISSRPSRPGPDHRTSTPPHGMHCGLVRKCHPGLKRKLHDGGERPQGLIRVGAEHIKQGRASIDLVGLWCGPAALQRLIISL